jgi:putative membrane protein
VIEYDRTSWWKTCFALTGTALPHILGRVGMLTLFCLALFLFDEHVLKPEGFPLQPLDPLGHTVMGVALSLLIVFRTNTAFARFWEARSLWGALVNASRNLVRLGAVYAGPADELARLVAAYVVLLREQLRDNRDLEQVRHLLPGRVLERLAGVNNPASVLAGCLSEWVAGRLAEGRIDTIQAMQLEALVCALVDAQGACEKIRRTPIPFVYAALTKQVLFLYLGTLPFVLIRLGVMAPLLVTGVALGMLGIEEAGVEIEDPFWGDPNHLPLEAICATIARDTADLAGGGKG